MHSTYFIGGEPALWLGSGYDDWKQTLAAGVPHVPSEATGISLEFRVSSLLRHGQRFDLDNMVSPVFQALLGPRRSTIRGSLTWWRASLAEYRPPGLALSFSRDPAGRLVVPGREPVLDVRIAAPYPSDSREGGATCAASISAAVRHSESHSDDRFAVDIAFGNDLTDISWVEEAPLKPLIDCLFPVVGGVGGDPHDWKVCMLHVRRNAPELERQCAIKVWALGEQRLPEVAAPRRPSTPAPTLPPTKAPIVAGRSTGMGNSERLDEAARELGSPPKELALDDIIRRAKALFAEIVKSSKDSLSATMDFQTINVRGRANKAGDFDRSDRWNRNPAFLKTRPATYRRLSNDERALFHELFAKGEKLLRQESYGADEWDALVRKHRKS